MPDFDDETESDDFGPDEDPDPSDQDSTDEYSDECPHCGKYIFEDAAVCPHCLTPIDTAVHNWRHGKAWFIAGLLCIVLILAATFLVMGWAALWTGKTSRM